MELTENFQEKIDLIKSWAEEHPEFDTAFVDSIEEKLLAFGTLTTNQNMALDRIIDKWRIDE